MYVMSEEELWEDHIGIYIRSSKVGKVIHFCMSVAWSFGVQLVVFFFSDISLVLFHTLGFSRCHNRFLLSPLLCLIIIRKPSCGPNVLVLNPCRS